MPQSLLEIAKDLTLALVEASSLSAEHMPDTLQQTYAILAALQAQEETTAASLKTQQPAAWRQSITRHSITCLEWVAYLRPADNSDRPLGSRPKGLNRPVINTSARFSIRHRSLLASS